MAEQAGRAGAWEPIRSIDNVDVIRVDRGGEPRVLLVDKRTWRELADLTPADACEFADTLYAVGEDPVRPNVGA